MSESRPPVALSEGDRAKIAAADGHVALGDRGVPALVEMLAEPSWVVRRAAIAGLAALGEMAAPQLLGALREGRDDENRVAATVDALSASTANLDERLVLLLSYSDSAVVCDAAQVLGRRRAASAVRPLERLIDGTDDNAAVAAIEALGRIGGTEAVDSLIRAARSGSFFRVFPAIDVLGRTGDSRAIGPLSELLDAPLYTAEAARALARTGDRAAVIPLARLLLREGSVHFRTAAVALADLHERADARHGSAAAIVQALAPLGRTATVSRRLVQGLHDADPAERVAVCTVLGALANDEAAATLAGLVDAPPPVGPAAVQALARMGKEAQRELLRVLHVGASAQRLALLPFVSGPSAELRAIECLGDADPEVRALACRTLGRLGNADRVGPLFDRLEDRDPGVVQAAIAAIQSLGGAETEMRALGLARSNVQTLRRSAIRILAYFGYPSAFDVLYVSLGDPDPRVRDTAIGGLGFVEDERATLALLRAAGDSADRVRSLAMKALGERTAEERIVRCLTEGLGDSNAWVRYYACQSLGRLRIVDAAATIARLLGDDAGHVRVAAVEALARLGGSVAEASLLEAANSKDEDVRRAALVGLGMARHPGALGAILEASRAADPMTRLFAVSSLSVVDAPEAVPALIAGARDPVNTVRATARECLASRPGVATAEALIALLDTSEDQEWVVTALSSPAEGRVAAVMSALAGASERLARQLVSVLGRTGTPEAVEGLIKAMHMPSAATRRTAAPTLGALGTRDALAVLERVAKADPDFEVRRVVSLLLPP